MKSPCQFCENREVGCHSKCELYADYRSEIEHRNRIIREQRQIEKIRSYKYEISLRKRGTK